MTVEQAFPDHSNPQGEVVLSRIQRDNAERLARAILNGFEAMFADFTNVTLGAKARFENEAWQSVQEASIERIGVYKGKVESISQLIEGLIGQSLFSKAIWQRARSQYVDLIQHHANFEIAESFFNSVYCKVFGHASIDDRVAFVSSSQSVKSDDDNAESLYNSYYPGSQTTDLTRELLDGCLFDVPFEDKERDIRNIVAASREQLLKRQPDEREGFHVDVLKSIFYRSKAAYIVGRIVLRDEVLPFVLPIIHNDRGEVFVDTLIFDPDDLSIVFSFTRSYFMVDTGDPSKVVDFLHGLMPQKARSELYACIGFRKHSKTDFYRDFIRHMSESDDQFIIAPGIKGMVMSVFTLPSYGFVFKIIKDKFAPPKEMSREDVKEKYRMVTRHDRVGRMADTQEFSNFVFDKKRFSPELLDELQEVCPSLLHIDGNKLIIKHLYIERRMEPLNLYLGHASEQEIEDVMDEYGNAIKQLAAANIFPGDMLLKNFGVTRHKRVVFYDYDEICPITDCVFRVIPEPKTEEQAMSSELWYSVGPNDIFPEEFRLFFSGNPKARKAFERRHSDLYDVNYWQAIQNNIRNGIVLDVFPYRRRKRFKRGTESNL